MSEENIEDFVRRGYVEFNRALPELEMAQVITVEDGKIRRLHAFTDRAEAQEAAGVRE